MTTIERLAEPDRHTVSLFLDGDRVRNRASVGVRGLALVIDADAGFASPDPSASSGADEETTSAGGKSMQHDANLCGDLLHDASDANPAGLESANHNDDGEILF